MPLFPGAELYAADGGPTGVLLLHGFTGSPKSMTPWGQRMAAEGHTVRVPRLPGHGTKWQDMNLTRWEDWYAEADRSFIELQKSCERVFVMGLSMGGSLTLRLAETKGDAIRGIVLVNPAVHSERPDRFALPIMQLIVPAFPGVSNDIKKPGVDEGAYDKLPLKAAHSLTKLWKLTKAELPSVNQPVLLFRSEEDHVVEASNSRYILDHVSSTDKTEVVLKDSYHVATIDNDAEIIVAGSIDFVRRLSG